MTPRLYSRADLVRLADVLLNPIATEGVARPLVYLPGRPSKWGLRSDGLEGFSRPLLTAAMRITAVPSRESDSLADFYRRGIERGTQPWGPYRSAWPILRRNQQPVVEAAAICLALMIAREELWEPLPEPAKQRFVDWVSDSLNTRPYENNWVLFQCVVATFLKAIGRESGLTRTVILEAQARLDEWYDPSGWYSDGPNTLFDYYNAWCFHFYPPLLAKLTDNTTGIAKYGDRLATFLESYRSLFAASGAPVTFGRSLIYKFGLAAPFWMAGVLGIRPEEAGGQRRAGSRVLAHFEERGFLSKSGHINRSWDSRSDRVGQFYSGPASPYWAGKGLVGLLIPAEDPFWQSEPSRAQGRNPDVHHLPAGMLSSNNGTTAKLYPLCIDEYQGKSPRRLGTPFYDRLAFSSATSPAQKIIGVRDNAFSVKVGRNWSVGGEVVGVASGRFWASRREAVARPRFLAAAPLFNIGKLDSLGDRLHVVPGAFVDSLVYLVGDMELWVHRVQGVAKGSRVLRTGWPYRGHPMHDVNGSFEGGGQNTSCGRRLIGLWGLTGAGEVAARVVSGEPPTRLIPTLRGVTGDDAVFVCLSSVNELTMPLVFDRQLDGDVLTVAVNNAAVSVNLDKEGITVA